MGDFKYTKEEAIVIAQAFIIEVKELEKKYNMTFSSDSNIYLSFKSTDYGKVWDTIRLGWIGDGSGIKVMEEFYNKSKIKEQALSKLTDEEKEVLGIK